MNTFVDDLSSALSGTAIIAIGVPVFALWQRLARPGPGRSSSAA